MSTIDVTLDGITVDGVPRQFSWSLNATRAQVPAPVTFTATRTASTVTVRWTGAVERGVPVTRYDVAGWDNGWALSQSVGPSVRELTAPYTAPGRTLSVTVTPQSRAGYPPVLVYLAVPPPGSGTPPPPPAPFVPGTTVRPPAVVTPPPPAVTPPRATTRAHFVGVVTLRATRPGRLRPGIGFSPCAPTSAASGCCATSGGAVGATSAARPAAPTGCVPPTSAGP